MLTQIIRKWVRHIFNFTIFSFPRGRGAGDVMGGGRGVNNDREGQRLSWGGGGYVR